MSLWALKMNAECKNEEELEAKYLKSVVILEPCETRSCQGAGSHMVLSRRRCPAPLWEAAILAGQDDDTLFPGPENGLS